MHPLNTSCSLMAERSRLPGLDGPDFRVAETGRGELDEELAPSGLEVVRTLLVFWGFA